MAHFIVIEGLDGAGSTTQVRLLAERLRAEGIPVVTTAEPSGGEVGLQIRAILEGRKRRALRARRAAPDWDRRSLALLFAADRLDHLQRRILPALSSGTHVISDRYLLSSLAYQSLDAPMEWVEAINRYARAPDRTIYLEVDPEEALRRRLGESEAQLFESLPLQRRIADNYRRAISVLEASHGIRVVDGAAPVEAVAESVWAALRDLFVRD